MLNIYKKIISKNLILISITVLTACGGGDDGGGDGADSSGPSIIAGRIVDDASQPLANVLVSTVPPTESRLTDAGGFFQIADNVFDGEIYDVNVQQIGYTASSQRISVAAGGASNVDFVLRPSVDGLAASITNLQITGNEQATFLLTSTINNVQYSLNSTNSQFIISPSQGTINSNERDIITVTLRDPNNPTRLTAQLIGDITNRSGKGFDVDLIGNPDVSDPPPMVDIFIAADSSDTVVNTNNSGNPGGPDTDNPVIVDPDTDGPEPTGITNLNLTSQAANDVDRRDGLSVTGQIDNNSLRINSRPGPGGANNACASDFSTSSSWFWQLPLKFTGDISDSLGFNLSFSLRHSGSPNTTTPLVIIIGSDGTSYTHTPNSYPGAAWINYEIPLVPDNFVISGSNTRPTAADFEQTLESVVELLVLGDFSSSTNTDVGCISQVSLEQQELPITYGLFESFDNSGNGFAGVNGVDNPLQLPAGGAPGAHLCLEDSFRNSAGFWSASDSFTGDWSGLFGEEIHYRVSSSSL